MEPQKAKGLEIEATLEPFGQVRTRTWGMVALVERGAPRDFRDIYALCQADMITPIECWDLWRQRQQLTGSDTESSRARLAVETHPTRIASQCRLDQIVDRYQRTEAEQVHSWFREEFLDALPAAS